MCEKLAPRRDILIYAPDLAPERRRPAPLGEPALDLGRVRHLRGTSGSRRWRVDGAGIDIRTGCDHLFDLAVRALDEYIGLPVSGLSGAAAFHRLLLS